MVDDKVVYYALSGPVFHPPPDVNRMNHEVTMDHSLPLISTLVGSLAMAYVFGMLAYRLKVSPMVGYLLAGVLVGPFTPGYVADGHIAPELAEIGVILLMFGVGLHFSIKDLLAVKMIAVPGAIVQILIATLLGAGLALLFGWNWLAALIFGLSLSVASTVVLLRALETSNRTDSHEGKIAVGWLIVEDLVMVLALVLLPLLANLTADNAQTLSVSHLLQQIGLTLGKVAAFILIMMMFGRRLIPWLLARSAATGSREMFTLTVLVIALGIAFGAVKLFDVSFALGAFFAGIVLNGSELSHKAAHDTLPLRDAFAVLFFVSVGMLFNPVILIHAPFAVLASLLIVVVGKSCAAYGLVRLFRHDKHTALTISISLAQIGEFSFILLGLGILLGVVPTEARDIVLAAAILSILVNPMLFGWLARYDQRKQGADIAPTVTVPAPGKVVLVGAGKVGSRVAEQLLARQVPLVVIDTDAALVEGLQARGFDAVRGNAVLPDTLVAAGLQERDILIVAIPNSFEAGEIVAQQRALHPGRLILACAYLGEEMEWLQKQGATHTINGAVEIAERIVQWVPNTTESAA